jgi:hypothetical protein
VTTYLPYTLLFIALLIALGFAFVNGFHHAVGHALRDVLADVLRISLLPLPVLTGPRRASLALRGLG